MLTEIGYRLLLSALLTALIKGAVALMGHSIAWVWAALIACAIVFGLWLIIDGDIIN